MDNLFLIAGLVGFAPAMFIIWFSMRKYAYPYLEGSAFEDRKVFFLLAVGMIFGTLLVTLERFFYPYFAWNIEDSATGEVIGQGFDIGMFLVVYVLTFVLLESLAKFIVINWKDFRGRFDSMFYGISFSAGFAATAMVGLIYQGVRLYEAQQVDSGIVSGLEIMDWVGLCLLSIGTAFIHTSVGALLGASTANKEGLRGFPQAVIPHIIFNLLMLPWFLGYAWISIAFIVPLSIIIYRGVHLHTIPENLPEEIIKELRRSERKEMSRRRV